MINNKNFLECLKNNKIEFYTGVPDSLLKSFLGYIKDNIFSPMHITAVNEGNAVGLAIGSYLASGKMPLVYLQNSGLGNAINPLLSIADNSVYAIPMILLVGWRGQPNTIDEPQHFKQGMVTTKLLESIQIPYSIINNTLSEKEVIELINKACIESFRHKHPFVILVEEDTFEAYNSIDEYSHNNLISREEALETCLNSLGDKDIIVSTTGKLSRELYEIRENKKLGHSNDFLTVGGMGHANQIALGIAINKPDKNIYCFDGDGALLMHMGSMCLNGTLKLKNYKHILFNNKVHDSVGGQYTSAPNINFKNLAKTSGYGFCKRTNNKNDIIKYFNIIKNNKSSSFLEILVNKGSRKDLSRPKSTPKENKEAFIKKINE